MVRGALAILHQLKRVYWPLRDFIQRQGRTPRIISATKGAVAPKSRPNLCLFAHYDRNAIVDDYVVYYLKQLHDANFETIVISTSERLCPDGLESARPFCREIVVRKNIGYDFGSWKVGLERAGDLSAYECLLLANDSVYGPLFSLPELLETMRRRDLDACGATDSWQLAYHLQSYFLLFQPSVFLSKCFARYWANLPYYRFKQTVIWNCELGFSRCLARARFRLGALVEYDALRRRHSAAVENAENSHFTRIPVNPTHHLWQPLISECRFPFVKVELLRDNPKQLKNIWNWRDYLSRTTEYNVDLIDRHLARMGRRGAHMFGRRLRRRLMRRDNNPTTDPQSS